ncbi:hypothetical protein FDP41_011770 [Naegleria fowleri]|uniref:Gamma-glutamylcyclotransferase n=1 Tax=Naegleria fowleri TaxID=5763 RepID=A0A6A5C9E9_NAEFO|nr:uncharacterized protein FDP41_011770 [Naegleria fowleri]KAF0981909.1 hypothetical protein FDP41_011770 [Naegleria fowleri]CAG4717947.1 unnamed protein product [Naegleria fowleri]
MSASNLWPQQQEHHVWYCSYGSNCNMQRFSVYLNGGKPIGSSLNAPSMSGCRVSSSPLKSQPILLEEYQMIFSRVSRTWHGGGVCFIKKNHRDAPFICGDDVYNGLQNCICKKKSNENVCNCVITENDDFNSHTNHVLGRIHKIMWSQFVDVVSQENGGINCKLEGRNHIQQQLDDYYENIISKLRETGEFKLFDTWYGNIMLIGFHPEDGCPIITFTTSTFEQEVINKAHESYLNTIAEGISEAFKICEKRCAMYFFSKKGVKEFYSLEELALRICKAANNLE